MPAVEGTALKWSAWAAALHLTTSSMTAKSTWSYNMAGVRMLLRNVNPDHHHRVELKLVGGSKGPRDAVGATVYLTTGGIRQRGSVLSGGSCLSSNDLRVHFGLADGMDAGRQRFTGLLAKRNRCGCPR